MALTDISGIGSKTAAKLRKMGIRDKQELFERFRKRDSKIVGGPGRSGLNDRALRGIRNAMVDSGDEFVDPVFGVPVTEENKKAREAFDLDVGSDVASGFGKFTRDNPRFQDTNVLDLAGDALKGDLGAGLQPEDYEVIAEQNDIVSNRGPRESDEKEAAKREAFEFGLDAAANLSPFDRETIEKGNELSKQTAGMGSFTARQTEKTKRETRDGVIEAEDNISFGARDFAKAVNRHQNRSKEARRVDNNRKAPVTGDFDKWKNNPSAFDYPGVDTPMGRGDIVNEQQQEQAGQIEEVVSGADSDVTEIAFGDPLEDIV